MKINIINKTYIVLSIILIIAIISKIMIYKSWDRYYYSSGVCTNTDNPIYIRECYFLTDTNETYSLDTNNVNEFKSSWGEEGYLGVYEPMRLPNRLVIQYTSYNEKKFYNDTLVLSEKKIRQVFKKAEQTNKFKELHSYPENKKGLNFLVGITNNGNGIIWLRGVFLEEVILKFKLIPREPKNNETYYEKQLSKEEYLNKIFKHLPDKLKTSPHKNKVINSNYIDSSTYYIEQNTKRWNFKNKSNK